MKTKEEIEGAQLKLTVFTFYGDHSSENQRMLKAALAAIRWVLDHPDAGEMTTAMIRNSEEWLDENFDVLGKIKGPHQN